MKQTILIFDFLSHENMHLPFNEGYIKSLRSGFPDDEIIFAATDGHIENIKSRLTEKYQIELCKIKNFDDLLGNKSYHNPLFSLPASKDCWRTFLSIAKSKSIRHICILGANGPLIHVFSKKWAKTQQGPIHFIQHNQLSTSMRWRSRNPIYKYFDYLSVIERGLPENQKMVMLELGLKETLLGLAPKLKGSVITIEHPVLESESLSPKPLNINTPIKVAFLGHCGKGKGFDKFVELSNKYSGKIFEFYAIGKNNSDIDTSTLIIPPCEKHLSRSKFISLLKDMDIICIPIPSSTSYVSSGSIIDGFAALKPLILTENQSNLAIQEKYGEYGLIVKNQNSLDSFFSSFSIQAFQGKYELWQQSLKKIRQARSEQVLGRYLSDIIS